MNLIEAVHRRLRRPTATLHGYDEPELVDLIFRKTVAFQPKELWAEVVGAASVLDFGGGCGLHYKEANSTSVRWAVVETPAMAARAEELATDKLRFFTSISDAAAWLGPIDVMHSNSALQYSPAPAWELQQLCALRAKLMLWSRLSLSFGSTEREIQTSRLGDNGPGRIQMTEEKTINIERTKIPESEFLAAHHDYTLCARGADWFRFALK